jgi:hypothetical protein
MNAEQFVRLIIQSKDFADFQNKIFMVSDFIQMATERERKLIEEIERLCAELERLKRTTGEVRP